MKNKYRYYFLMIVLLVLLACGDSDSPVKPGVSDNGGVDTLPPNTPPVILEYGDTSTTVGATFWMKPMAYDADGDSLIFGGFVHTTMSDIRLGTIPVYRFIGYVGPLYIGVLEFLPQPYDPNSRKVTLHVHDGRGGADSTSFRVYINR